MTSNGSCRFALDRPIGVSGSFGAPRVPGSGASEPDKPMLVWRSAAAGRMRSDNEHNIPRLEPHNGLMTEMNRER